MDVHAARPGALAVSDANGRREAFLTETGIVDSSILLLLGGYARAAISRAAVAVLTTRNSRGSTPGVLQFSEPSGRRAAKPLLPKCVDAKTTNWYRRTTAASCETVRLVSIKSDKETSHDERKVR